MVGTASKDFGGIGDEFKHVITKAKISKESTMYEHRITPDHEGGRFGVTFANTPEGITQGGTGEAAMAAAHDALEIAMDFYFSVKREVPAPSEAKRGRPVVELPASLAAKVQLLNELVRQKVRPAELAHRISTSPQEVNRLTNIKHKTSIDSIAAALAVMGRHLDLSVA